MIYITGDTHRDIDTRKLSEKNFPEQKKLTKEDYLIIAGDFGGIWYSKERDDLFLEYYKKKPFTTLFVDGNHENFDRLNQYDVCDWCGGKVHMINDSVIHLMRGQVYTIDQKKIFTFGGGISVDKEQRIPHRSWWEDENPSYGEIEEALTNLDKNGNCVDYIITHACPESVVRNELNKIHSLMNIYCPTEKFLDSLLDKVQYIRWFCGHYHMDAFIKPYRIEELYQNIIRCDDNFSVVSKTKEA